MMFAAADGYFDWCCVVLEVRAQIADGVSFFLGFVALDYYWGVLHLASRRARPDRVLKTEAHGDGC